MCSKKHKKSYKRYEITIAFIPGKVDLKKVFALIEKVPSMQSGKNS